MKPRLRGPRPPLPGGGFTLLEVLVALAVVGLAITGVLQLSAQSLRLLKLSSEHVDAVNLADRLVREGAPPEAEGTDTGQQGPYTWERKVTRVAVPAELEPASPPGPALFSISVQVKWAPNRSVELATMRTVVPSALTPLQPGAAPPARPGLTTGTLPGQTTSSPGSLTPSTPRGGPFGSGGLSGAGGPSSGSGSSSSGSGGSSFMGGFPMGRPGSQ